MCDTVTIMRNRQNDSVGDLLDPYISAKSYRLVTCESGLRLFRLTTYDDHARNVRVVVVLQQEAVSIESKSAMQTCCQGGVLVVSTPYAS